MSDNFYISSGKPIECPFCHSTYTEVLETTHEQINRHLDKPQSSTSGNVRVTSYDNDMKDYYIRKLLCLQCGQISKSLPQNILKE